MKLKSILMAAAAAFMLSSCGAYVSSPVTGFLYTDVKAPITATDATSSSKVGTAEASSVLGWVATGDASIEAAAKSAGITTIHHVDYHAKNILGIYATYTVYVYGE